MSCAISSEFEILEVLECLLDIHVEKYWQVLIGKIINKVFSTGDH